MRAICAVFSPPTWTVFSELAFPSLPCYDVGRDRHSTREVPGKGVIYYADHQRHGTKRRDSHPGDDEGLLQQSRLPPHGPGGELPAHPIHYQGNFTKFFEHKTVSSFRFSPFTNQKIASFSKLRYRKVCEDSLHKPRFNFHSNRLH